MARESYSVTVLDWRHFLDQLDEEMARSIEMKDQVALLEGLYVRAQDLVHQRAVLKASMMALTREIQTTLRTGRTTVDYLRAAAKIKIPSGSPARKNLGIITGGRPRKKRKAPASRK